MACTADPEAQHLTDVSQRQPRRHFELTSGTETTGMV
jgi:hypothetical protein